MVDFINLLEFLLVSLQAYNLMLTELQANCCLCNCWLCLQTPILDQIAGITTFIQLNSAKPLFWYSSNAKYCSKLAEGNQQCNHLYNLCGITTTSLSKKQAILWLYILYIFQELWYFVYLYNELVTQEKTRKRSVKNVCQKLYKEHLSQILSFQCENRRINQAKVATGKFDLSLTQIYTYDNV